MWHYEPASGTGHVVVADVHRGELTATTNMRHWLAGQVPPPATPRDELEGCVARGDPVLGPGVGPPARCWVDGKVAVVFVP